MFPPFICINCSFQTTHDYVGISQKKMRKLYTKNLQQTTDSKQKKDQHLNHNIPIKH